MSNTLRPGESLNLKEGLKAANGLSRVLLQPDGNLVLYRDEDGKALWASNTSGKPVAKVIMQPDGNLVCYSSDGRAYWATGTWRFKGSRAVLQDDGNFVLYTSQNVAIWASNTCVNANPVEFDTNDEHLGTGQWMHSWASMAKSGLITGHTKIWTNNELSGFHGSVVAMLTDDERHVVWPADPDVSKHNYGVDGKWIPGLPSSRTQFWSNQVDAVGLQQGKRLVLVHFLDPRNQLLRDVNIAGKVVEEAAGAIKAVIK